MFFSRSMLASILASKAFPKWTQHGPVPRGSQRLLKKSYDKQYKQFYSEYEAALKLPEKEIVDCEQILLDVAASRERAEEDQDRSESAKTALLGRIDNMEQRAKQRIADAEKEKVKFKKQLNENLALLGEYEERPYDEADYLLTAEEIVPEITGKVQVRTRMTQRKQLTAEEIERAKKEKERKNARAARPRRRRVRYGRYRQPSRAWKAQISCVLVMPHR
mgnify:CR=1 FL=1